MEMKHTPGPWVRIGTDVGTAEFAIASMSVMSVVTMKRDEREANARLIAAAPELLDALEALTHSVDYEDLLHDDQRSAFKQARAVIAKATGQ